MIKALTSSLLFFGLVLATPASADIIEDLEKAETYLAEGEDRKAYKAYRSLARAGHFPSQRRLAEFYAQGVGTKPDPVEAYAWSVLAAETGREEFVEYSGQLLAAIPADTQPKAEKTAEKLMKKYGVEAQLERQLRLAEREKNLNQCTGSRVSCSRATQSYDADATGVIAPQPIPTVGDN